MAGEVSFDVVSEFDHQELVNALDQARREIGTRYDFKGAKAELELGKGGIILRRPPRSGSPTRCRSSTRTTADMPSDRMVRALMVALVVVVVLGLIFSSIRFAF